MPFGEAQLDRIRAASPRISVTRDDPAGPLPEVSPVHGQAPAGPAQAPDLRWIQLHMAGVNSFQEHPFYRDSDIPLTTTSGVHASTIAEYVIAVLLALAPYVPRMVEWHGRKAWPPDADRWRLFVPTEVRGATIGLIGYGSIGRELARITVSAFGMTVLACKRNPAERTDRGYGLPGTGDREGRLPAGWFGPTELPRMLPRCDVVVLCAPLTAETRRLIDQAAISAMKPTAYFINVGQGASVDEAALAEALREKRIAGAGIASSPRSRRRQGIPSTTWTTSSCRRTSPGSSPATTGVPSSSPRTCAATWPASRS